MPEGDILLLASDIVSFAVMNKQADFFNHISDTFPTIYLIPGNHEYYYFDATTKRGTLYEEIRNNVFLIKNTSVRFQKLQLIFLPCGQQLVG